ncbi:DUF3990 domain-containing protein [Phocaeicola sp.]
MILYHGTNIDFDIIDLLKSKPNKDFGRGFYLTESLAQAQDMAQTKTDQLECGSPTVIKYELDEQCFSDGSLSVKRFMEYSEEWAEFILANRNNPNSECVHSYDVVIGPIADDRVGVQLWKYDNQLIDLPTLVKNLKYMKGITIQYFFGTERAIKKLKRL